jgi:ribosomal protein S18 acetylase RimI-like enzyme
VDRVTSVRTSRVTSEDLPDLVPLLAAYAAFYGESPADADLLAMAEAFLAAPEHDGVRVVARGPEGDALGFATVLWSWDTTLGQRLAVMEDLFVAEAARGAGVGRRLLEACRELAAASGYRCLQWQTAPDNATAQRLYDATGANRSTWLTYRLPT